MEWVKVTEEEFAEFLKTNSHKLRHRTVYFVTPPCRIYSDTEHGEVAKTWVYDTDPTDYYYTPKERREYYLSSELMKGE